MTTARLYERLRALPDDASEREVKRVMLWAVVPRFAVAAVLLIAWKWAIREYVSLPPILERLVDDAGSMLVLAAAIYPLLRLTRMSDEEFERTLGVSAESTRR